MGTARDAGTARAVPGLFITTSSAGVRRQLPAIIFSPLQGITAGRGRAAGGEVPQHRASQALPAASLPNPPLFLIFYSLIYLFFGGWNTPHPPLFPCRGCAPSLGTGARMKGEGPKPGGPPQPLQAPAAGRGARGGDVRMRRGLRRLWGGGGGCAGMEGGGGCRLLETGRHFRAPLSASLMGLAPPSPPAPHPAPALLRRLREKRGGGEGTPGSSSGSPLWVPPWVPPMWRGKCPRRARGDGDGDTGGGHAADASAGWGIAPQRVQGWDVGLGATAPDGGQRPPPLPVRCEAPRLHPTQPRPAAAPHFAAPAACRTCGAAGGTSPAPQKMGTPKHLGTQIQGQAPRGPGLGTQTRSMGLRGEAKPPPHPVPGGFPVYFLPY